MPKSPARKAEKTELPGVRYDRFEAGVRALVDLRDRGKFLVFLARRRSVQLIGSLDDFLAEMPTEPGGKKFERKDIGELLEEIRRYLAVRVDVRNVKRVADVLIDAVYGGEFRQFDAPTTQQFREELEKKAVLVEQQLYTPALETRGDRFGSTTAACLEDLEFELVEERSTGSRDQPLRDPFLRLRIRYSDGTEPSPRGFGLIRLFPVFPFAGKEHSFELECDESDIDLLIVRLAAAKQRLLKARHDQSDSGNA